MRQTRPIAIEHVVGALEARLGPAQDWVAIWHSLDVLSLSKQSRAEVPLDSEQAAYVGSKELVLVGLNPRWENVTMEKSSMIGGLQGV